MTKYATVDPTTGKVLAEYATMPDADVEQALARAAEAYRSWREADLAERTTVLSRVADLHRQHETELAKLMPLAYLFLAGPFDKCAIASPSPSSVR